MSLLFPASATRTWLFSSSFFAAPSPSLLSSLLKCTAITCRANAVRFSSTVSPNPELAAAAAGGSDWNADVVGMAPEGDLLDDHTFLKWLGGSATGPTERRKLARMVKNREIDGPGETPETLVRAGRLFVGVRKYGEASKRFKKVQTIMPAAAGATTARAESSGPPTPAEAAAAAEAACGLAALDLIEHTDLHKCYRGLAAAGRVHRGALKGDAVYWFNVMSIAGAAACQVRESKGRDEKAQRYIGIARKACAKADELGSPGAAALLAAVELQFEDVAA